MKKIVLDTNILLVSISKKSKHHWIFSSLMDGEFVLCVSNEILMEYAEKGMKILDTHRGSASLDIACEILGFDLVTCEIDKDYFEIYFLFQLLYLEI